MSERAIINTYDQLRANGGGVAICYQARGDSRSLTSPSFVILRLDKNGRELATDPKAAWYDHGHKFFLVHGRDERAAKLAEAKEWVRNQYGEAGPWKRNRMGDYVPQHINDSFPLRKAAAIGGGKP